MLGKIIKGIKAFIVNIYIFLFFYDQWEEREKKRCFGKLNTDKTFYVIRFDKSGFGLMTIWKLVLAHIEYAYKNNYIPIIDLKNYYSMMIQNIDCIGKYNAWEYYFEQPDNGYTLEEIYHSKNVILAKKNIKLSEGVQLVKMPMTEEEFCFWTHISSLIPVKKEVELMAQSIKQELFPKGKKILGVSIRFEYSFLEEINHKIVDKHSAQPKIEEIIKDIEYYMVQWECEYCFMAIDDKEMLEILKRSIGDKCIYIDRWRRSFWRERELKMEPYSSYFDYPLRDTVKDRGIEYLSELLLLSKCDCFLAGKSSGNIFAYLKNGQQYEHICIYEKGEIHV